MSFFMNCWTISMLVRDPSRCSFQSTDIMMPGLGLVRLLFWLPFSFNARDLSLLFPSLPPFPTFTLRMCLIVVFFLSFLIPYYFKRLEKSIRSGGWASFEWKRFVDNDKRHWKKNEIVSPKKCRPSNVECFFFYLIFVRLSGFRIVEHSFLFPVFIKIAIIFLLSSPLQLSTSLTHLQFHYFSKLKLFF